MTSTPENPKRVAVFMGTRPEGVKLAPVIAALRDDPDFTPVVVVTGQHREMLDQVVELFEIEVDHDLAVMSADQTLAALSARLLSRVDLLLNDVRPDMALVQGDTTTALMTSLACFYRGVPVGHVEAGLRTGDLASPFPEEGNRRLVAPLAAVHFAPTTAALENLRREHIDASTVSVTGNTVIDALQLEVARQSTAATSAEVDAHLREVLCDDWNDTPFVLVTGHRRENFGAGFEGICTALRDLATKFPDHRFVYPVHLNPNVLLPVRERLGSVGNVHLIEPQPYRPFVALMRQSRLLLTDSGGVQEEAPSLGKPLLVMRETTERPEGVSAGTVKLVGTDPERIVFEVSRLLTDDTHYLQMSESQNPYGDGHAAVRIVAALRRYFGLSERPLPVGVTPHWTG